MAAALALPPVLAVGVGLALGSPHAESTADLRERSGDVRVRSPFDARWRRPDLGAPLLSDTLLWIGEDASASFEYRGAPGADERVTPTTVTVRTPLVARLGGSLIRQVQIGAHFTDQLPQPDDHGATSGKQSLIDRFLSAAWHKLVTLGLAADSHADRAGLAERRAVTHIKILLPGSGSVMSATSLPHQARVIWQSDDSAHLYSIYLKKGDGTSVPIGETADSQYVVTLPEYGDYEVAVTAVDGTSTPATTNFSVTAPGVSGVAGGPGAAGGAAPLLDLSTPPDELVIAGAGTGPIDLAWKRPRQADNALYQVTVKTDKGQVTAQWTTGGLVAAFNPPAPGTYVWQVLARMETNDGLDVRTLASEARRFNVIDARKTGFRGAALLDGALRRGGGKGRLLYLEEGL